MKKLIIAIAIITVALSSCNPRVPRDEYHNPSVSFYKEFEVERDTVTTVSMFKNGELVFSNYDNMHPSVIFDLAVTIGADSVSIDRNISIVAIK